MRITSSDVLCDGTREYRTADGRVVYEGLDGLISYNGVDTDLEEIQDAISWYWFRQFIGVAVIGGILVGVWAAMML